MRTSEEYLVEGVNDKAVLKAIFVVGGPGSGKSFIGNKIASSFGYKIISSDKIFEMIMKQENLDLDMSKKTNFGTSKYVQDLRKFARQVMYREKSNYITGRLGLLIDTPGYGTYVLEDKDRLEKLGYDTMMIFVKTTLKTSLDRNKNRDRVVPPKVVTTIHTSVMDTLPSYVKSFGRRLIVMDNDSYDTENELVIWKKVMQFTNMPVMNRGGKFWLKNNLKSS